MLGHIKPLIVVLLISALIFRATKPIALRFMSIEDFLRRRQAWFLLTAAGFLSPNIWLYALIAIAILIRANRNETNPVALYLLMLHVVPIVDVTIPIPGNHGLFSLNNYRLLALCVLLPATVRYRRNQRSALASTFGAMDVLLLTFGVLNVALYTAPDLPYHQYIPDSPTNAIRRGLLFLLDIYLLYFAVSRLCQTRHQLVDAIASYWLVSAVMAAIAVFERMRNWLLYGDIATQWSMTHSPVFYLERGGAVRAQVSAGHSIALGYLFVIAFGLWLYLQSRVDTKTQRVGGTVLLWGGLFGAFSRGGWLGGATVFFTFIAAGPRMVSRLVKGTAIALVCAGLVALSPLGDRIMELLPEAGKPADMYRHRLAERGWEVVSAHPFFGNQFPWPVMEDLRQGEGIIDIVNTYLGVALNYGFIGLFCFLSFILLGLIKVYARSTELSKSDPDLALLGTSLVACIVGVLLMIRSSSFMFGVEKMFYVLAGFAAAYVRIAITSLPPTVQAGVVKARLK